MQNLAEGCIGGSHRDMTWIQTDWLPSLCFNHCNPCLSTSASSIWVLFLSALSYASRGFTNLILWTVWMIEWTSAQSIKASLKHPCFDKSLQGNSPGIIHRGILGTRGNLPLWWMERGWVPLAYTVNKAMEMHEIATWKLTGICSFS